MSQSEKILSRVVKVCLWIIPFLPLYVSWSMLFPYITGKNFAFRAIVEIAFACWIALAWLWAEYRPRLTPLVKAVTVFIAIVFLADLISPNPYRAFFSNYERMEGFMMLGHLYLYFLMLVSMFRRSDWMIFFHMSLAASFLASVWGLLQRLGYYPSLQGGFRVDSTIGNPTYFAAYLLFHVWLLGVLLWRFSRIRWRAILYGALLGFEAVMIYFTATRGVVLALVVVAVPFAAAIVLSWNWMFRRAAERGNGAWSASRKAALAALAAAVLIPAVFWIARGSAWVQSSQALRRLTNYSLREGTVQDRMMIWRMSLAGVRERPILGWGQENYYLVFQKYFNPGLWGAEQWFDRSHNVLLDWAVHTGLLGLGAYLAIFAVFFWRMAALMRRDRSVSFEGLLLMGLFATYFLQNLFVFDNLNSYLLFFAFLAYGEYLAGGSPVSGEETGKRSGRRDAAGRGTLVIAAVLLAVVAVVGYKTIVQPMRESKALIRALSVARLASAGRAQPPEVQTAFADALAFGTFGDGETREQLGTATREIAVSDLGTQDQRKGLVDFALAELRKETKRPAKDVKHLLFLGTILNRALLLDTAYAREAEAIGKEAIALSPAKQPVYYELAQLYLSVGRVDESLRLLNDAWRLDKKNFYAAGNVWFVAALAGNQDTIAELRRSFALGDLGQDRILSIARAYEQAKNMAGAAEAYEALIASSPTSAQYHALYGSFLARAGRTADARVHITEAIRLDPGFERSGRALIEQLGR